MPIPLYNDVMRFRTPSNKDDYFLDSLKGQSSRNFSYFVNFEGIHGSSKLQIRDSEAMLEISQALINCQNKK